MSLGRPACLLALTLVGCVESRADEEFENLEIDTSGDVPVFSWDGPDAAIISITGSDAIDTLSCGESGGSGVLYYHAWCPDTVEVGVRATDEHNCMESPWTYGDPAPGIDEDDETYFYSRDLNVGYPVYCLELTAFGEAGEGDTISVVSFEI